MMQRVVATDTANVIGNDSALPCHYIPLSKNNHFVGREETLDKLKDVLFLQKSHKAAIVG